MENESKITAWLCALLIVVGVTLIGCTGSDDDMPMIYKTRCMKCHGVPNGLKKTVGPDLATSKYSLPQFLMQVKNGSRWEAKPKRKESFKNKKMPSQPLVTDADVKAIFKYIHKK